MSVLPLPRWVVKTRKAILWVGFGWPVAALLMATGQDGPDPFAAIGVMFLATIFVPPSLVLSVVLPTYKWRIIVVPLLLVAVYWWMYSMAADYNGFKIHPYMLLWITSFTAIGLLIPQYSTLEYFYRRGVRAVVNINPH
jgi:hypothetical protein